MSASESRLFGDDRIAFDIIATYDRQPLPPIYTAHNNMQDELFAAFVFGREIVGEFSKS